MNMTEDELLRIMNHTALIPSSRSKMSGKRTIYEAAGSRGFFFIDYAAYGGTTEGVPKPLIDRLEAEGKLVRAFPGSPKLNAWRLP
jgi:hypothetical protein